MLNYYLLTHIFSYLSCQQLTSLETSLKWLSPLVIPYQNRRCLSETCARRYWMSLSFKNINSRCPQLLKECCSRARINYIRGIHYRLRDPYQIWTNYLDKH